MDAPYEVSEKKICEKVALLMILIGKNIRKHRELNGKTRVDLAFHAKTTESLICKIENGKKEGVTIYTLAKISTALEITLYDLFCE